MISVICFDLEERSDCTLSICVDKNEIQDVAKFIKEIKPHKVVHIIGNKRKR